jgi:putative FmdB family regulatory protein
MPIYEYRCTACGHRTEILHGINDEGPRFCPACGAEGKLRKAITAPSIVFKGSGWAKTDRRAAPAGSSKSKGSGADGEAGSAPKTTDATGDSARDSAPDSKPGSSGGVSRDAGSSGSSRPASSSDKGGD